MTYLFCRKCGSTFSATPGDYWSTPLEHLFKCCRVNSWLVARGNRFTGDTVLRRRVTVAQLEG
jgi:hypothetical protein